MSEITNNTATWAIAVPSVIGFLTIVYQNWRTDKVARRTEIAANEAVKKLDGPMGVLLGKVAELERELANRDPSSNAQRLAAEFSEKAFRDHMATGQSPTSDPSVK